VTEIRKLGLGEEASLGVSSSSSAKDEFKKQWTPVQFWKIVQLLSKYEEISFDDLRNYPLFKGNEAPIQAIERAGLITVGLKNGRPHTIRAGRPIYRTAFATLLNDTKYAAIMGIRLQKALMAEEEAKITKYETEMSQLSQNLSFSSGSGFSLTRQARREVESRLEFLAMLLGESQKKIADYDAEERRLKKVVKLQE
jgi:hypothetical protein